MMVASAPSRHLSLKKVEPAHNWFERLAPPATLWLCGDYGINHRATGSPSKISRSVIRYLWEMYNMRRAYLVVFFILGFALQSFAGKIYGSITEAGKPVAQGVKVDVTCGSNNYSSQTDS